MEQTLGKRISGNRKRLGLTQDALAEKLGVTAQAVSKWENDQSCPDITMLPKLAEIFGITTDALLGMEQQSVVHESTVAGSEDDNDEGVHVRKGNWEFKYDNSRKSGITFAILVLLVGGLYLVSSIMDMSVGLWDIIWPSALLVFGLSGLLGDRAFSFLRLGCTLFGGFFLVNSLIPLPFELDNGVIFAIVLLLFGCSLLVDSLRKPKKPKFEFVYNSDSDSEHAPQRDYVVDGDSFRYNASFGEHHQQVNMDTLTHGEINVSFGEHEVDLSGVRQVSNNCSITVNSSFGELTIMVPSRYRILSNANASFASVDIEGQPDESPAGVITLEANASFGHITVEYV